MTAATMEMPPQALAFASICEDRLGRDVVGVYVHGSLVNAGLRTQSDLDLLLVTASPLESRARAGLLESLMALSAPWPATPGGPRCLDVLAVSRGALISPAYPARCEFLYGEWLRHEFEAGGVLRPYADPVITLLIAQARDEARPVTGPAFHTLLAPVPRDHVQRALADSLPALLGELRGDERNVLLTLARMWRTATVGDFVVKDAAAAWAADRLPPQSRDIVLHAGRAYRGELADDWSGLQAEAAETAGHLREQVLAALGQRPPAPPE